MKSVLKITLHRISGFLRTRVILSLLGIYAIIHAPQAGQWIAVVVGLALGVSAVDAIKGETKKDDSNES